MTRRYALLTLTVSAIFLMVVGVLTRGEQLFFMSTVMIVTLVMMRVQAELAVRGLRFERVAPQVIVAGELITMRIRVWSLTRIRRPLLLITDVLPPKLATDIDLRPLPVAPSFDEAVETRYEFRAARRGVFRWSKVRVRSTDSMGIVHVERQYESDPIEVVVHPSKIPLGFDLASVTGWGANQSDEGTNRGSGMMVHGVREYAPGDSLRHVHWRSTAKTGTMQVKEFDTGYNTNLIVIPQLTTGSDIGVAHQTTLEAMCGHIAYIADILLGRGSTITLPNVETNEAPAPSAEIRFKQICDALAAANANQDVSFADVIEAAGKRAPFGCTFVLLVSTVEPRLADAIVALSSKAPVLLMIYDPHSFPRDPKQSRFKSATDPSFIASLSQPRIRIKVLTNPFISNEKAA